MKSESDRKQQITEKFVHLISSKIPKFVDIFDEKTFYIFSICLLLITIIIAYIASNKILLYDHAHDEKRKRGKGFFYYYCKKKCEKDLYTYESEPEPEIKRFTYSNKCYISSNVPKIKIIDGNLPRVLIIKPLLVNSVKYNHLDKIRRINKVSKFKCSKKMYKPNQPKFYKCKVDNVDKFNKIAKIRFLSYHKKLSKRRTKFFFIFLCKYQRCFIKNILKYYFRKKLHFSNYKNFHLMDVIRTIYCKECSNDDCLRHSSINLKFIKHF
ncbi:hypothetical protein A3Q56_06035 [Intoshia linei]|uniref:Uncharacterized protein n=1 Tax=Intoshia linei TaxID=1819745 RepID=A0A177AXL8_9BILA|nr:hypothetical protein A3Q56_06035 [Intoshia linei]